MLLGDFNQLKDTSVISFPLKQVVKSLTRGHNILDKIYTNVHTWYQSPTVWPAIGKSDNDTIIFQPNADYDSRRAGDQSKVSYMRNRDSIGKALLEQALRYFI